MVSEGFLVCDDPNEEWRNGQMAAGDPSWAAVCPRYWKPVCAMKDGAIKTYPNSACATADGATVVAGTASGGYCLRRGPFKRKR